VTAKIRRREDIINPKIGVVAQVWPRMAVNSFPRTNDKSNRRIVLSGVNLTEVGPLSVFRDALGSLAANYGNEYEIVALVHKKNLFDVQPVTYLEFPHVKSSWISRLQFEYVRLKRLSQMLTPELWISMHDITPNVYAKRRAVYCHNPSPFYRFHFSEALANWKFGLFVLFYGFLYRINIYKNNFVIVQQDWIRNEFRRRYKAVNVIVAHPDIQSVNPRMTKISTRASRPFKFFYPAYPRPFKNAEVCLQACGILEQRSIENFELLLTFDGSENRYSHHLHQKFKGLNSVRWLGLQPRNEIFELYADADCLLFPSKLETWGMPITEFRSFGRPIIVADLPYAHETSAGHDQVVFFDPEDAERLADLMQAAISDVPTFKPAPVSVIEPPFARDWSELWALLLAKPE
jgi:glycosyltransferase involved in cell wall biosynthesis